MDGTNVPPKPADRFRSNYRQLDKDELNAMKFVKQAGEELERAIDKYVPVGREKSLAFTHLEDCVMRAVRGITE